MRRAYQNKQLNLLKLKPMSVVKQMRQQVKKYIDAADETTVKMVYAILEAKQEEDWWDSLPPKVKAEIDKALAELDKGKGIPHKVALKKITTRS